MNHIKQRGMSVCVNHGWSNPPLPRLAASASSGIQIAPALLPALELNSKLLPLIGCLPALELNSKSLPLTGCPSPGSKRPASRPHRTEEGRRQDASKLGEEAGRGLPLMPAAHSGGRQRTRARRVCGAAREQQAFGNNVCAVSGDRK